MWPGTEQLLSLLVTGIATVVVIVGIAVVIGFVVIYRRNRGGIDSVARELDTRAGSLLLRLDDSIRAGQDEVDFATAQFGPERTGPYADAVRAARADLAESFRLRQLLDDAQQDSARQRREWTLQIIANCERAQRRLHEQQVAYRQLREAEVGADRLVAHLRDGIATERGRLDAARGTVERLTAEYTAKRVAAVAGHPEEALSLLDQAGSALDAAAARVDADGVNSVTGDLQSVADLVARAREQLDQVDAAAAELAAADAALAELISAGARELEEAKPQREAAPDAETGGRIIQAMSDLDNVLATAKNSKDPVAALDAVGLASDQLDLALAGARNQQQRLAHARDAYAGALISARAQIAEAAGVMPGAGVDARTRLAEAQRQLGLAEVAADPVEALDTARRAITLARDADALARYARMR